ncbi:hypothetical protein J6590_030973 [Homalodisca vitripennis]|nr:hypothetical protein J6590_030973 [Homalodisca vitripennis]
MDGTIARALFCPLSFYRRIVGLQEWIAPAICMTDKIRLSRYILFLESNSRQTWLYPATPSDNYNMARYTLLRKDRAVGVQGQRSSQVGGGVAPYIKECIPFDVHSLSEDVDPAIETLCVVLRVKGLRLGLCTVYRPPTVRYSYLADLFHSLFVNLAVRVNSIMCLGDFNIDLSSKTSNEAIYLRRISKENNAIQIINEPTSD